MSTNSLGSSSFPGAMVRNFLPKDNFAGVNFQEKTDLPSVKAYIDRLHKLARNKPVQEELSLIAMLAKFIKSYLPVSGFVHNNNLVEQIDLNKVCVPVNVDEYLKQYSEFADLPDPRHLLQIVPIIVEGSNLTIFLTVDVETPLSEGFQQAVKKVSITPDIKDPKSALVNFNDLLGLPKALENKLEAVYNELKSIIILNLDERGFRSKQK